MKITTANIKSPQYTENHEIFVGTHTGSFKRMNTGDSDPHKQTNLQLIAALNKTSRITSLNWGSDNEILIGRANKFVKIYDLNSNDFTNNIEMNDGPVIGLARYNGRLVAGIENGHLQILNDKKTVLVTGDHMSEMRQCKGDKRLVATGGKGRQNNLKIWNLESEKQTFSSKNLPNDYLQLEVPVWDTGISFIDAHQLATCSRYGYVRTYDVRKQRRPVLSFENKHKEDMTYTCLMTHGHMLYAGTASGIVRAFDARKMKTIVHTYKGFTGSVSDICLDNSGKYLFTACLDRFVRVHCSESTALMYQCYVKSKATKIVMKNSNADDECTYMGAVDEEIDVNDENDKLEDRNQKKNVTIDREFDALFDNMETVGDESENNVQPKKRHLLNSKKLSKKKKRN